jgi:hypothetical protein
VATWKFQTAWHFAVLSFYVLVTGHFDPMARCMAALQYNLLHFFLAVRTAPVSMAAGLDAFMATGQALTALRSADQS